MDGKDELIISAIKELKDEQKATREEISAMNKAVASLASYHQRLNNLEESIKDLPRMKVVVNGIVWVVGILSTGLILTVFRGLSVSVTGG